MLAQLLEIQESLEERGVQLWAAEQLAAVAALAKAGDELYRNRGITPRQSPLPGRAWQLQALRAGIPPAVAATGAGPRGPRKRRPRALPPPPWTGPMPSTRAMQSRRPAPAGGGLPQLLTCWNSGRGRTGGDLPAAITLLKQAAVLDPATSAAPVSSSASRPITSSPQFNGR